MSTSHTIYLYRLMYLFDAPLLNVLNRCIKADQPPDNPSSISRSMLIVCQKGPTVPSVEWAHPSSTAEPKGRFDEEASKKRSHRVSAKPIAWVSESNLLDALAPPAFILVPELYLDESEQVVTYGQGDDVSAFLASVDV